MAKFVTVAEEAFANGFPEALERCAPEIDLGTCLAPDATDRAIATLVERNVLYPTPPSYRGVRSLERFYIVT